MGKLEFDALAAILQDNIGQKLTVALGLGIIHTLGQAVQELQQLEPIPAKDASQ